MIVQFNILDQALFDQICAKYPPDTMIITKNEYLRERKKWKARYKKVVETIKALKGSMQVLAIDIWEYMYILEDQNGARSAVTACGRLQSLKAGQSYEATMMMAELRMLKDDARLSVDLLRSKAIEEVRRNT